MEARNVVVASGATRVPAVPGFTLGTGCGHPAAAFQRLPHSLVRFAGRATPHVPDAVFRLAGYLATLMVAAFVNGVLTRSTPIGRKIARGFHSRGAPRIRISMKQVEAAGVQRLPRITGVAGGQPIANAAAVPRPATVIWATEYRSCTP